MPFLRLQRLTLGLIAFLAVGWAQTFGLPRGWLCDCGGVEGITQVDHCHGPHSHACHDDEDEDHSVPHQHDDEEDDGDTHPHAAVVDSLIAKEQNDFAFSISAPVQVLCLQSIWDSVIRVPSFDEHCAEKPPPWVGPAEQSWPRLLTRAIALRI